MSIKVIENVKVALNCLDNDIDKTKINNISEFIQCKDIQLLQGDILEYEIDYNNTSVVFINCKTFSKDLMQKIAIKLNKMPSGVICITSSQIMSEFDDNWILVDKMRRLMSWGCANLYIHVKK